MPVYEIRSFRGGISDYEDKGIPGSFKLATNANIRKVVDSLSCNQALVDIGSVLQSASASPSPSASRSPSASSSPSLSASVSPSSSVSPSLSSPSSSLSPSASRSPSASVSPSHSLSPSTSISPSPSPSAGLKSTWSDLVRWWVKCSDGNLYGFGNTGKVYKVLADGAVFQVYDAHEQIRGAEEKPSSSGKTYLVFAGITTLHHKEIPGNGAWNDVDKSLSNWPKENLTSADWHTMKQVAGDVLIANASTLAFVGYDDSYTNDALDLIPGRISKTLVERNGRAVIGTYLASDPTKGVNAAIDAEVPIAQVGDDGDLFFADMTSSIPIKRLPGGGKINPGGIANEVDQVNFFDWEADALSWIDKQNVGNMALMGVYGASSGYGGLYSLGRKNKNHPFTLNLEYLLDVDEIGAVAHWNGNTYISYRSGSTFGVKMVDATTKAVAQYYGLDFRSPMNLPVNITPWKYTEIFMAPLPSGASVEFWYRLNKTGSFIQAKTAGGDTSYTTVGGKKAEFRIGAEGEIFEPSVVLHPSGNNTPEVYRIRTYFGN